MSSGNKKVTKLSPNWIQVDDTTNNRTYFANTKTNESVWQKPIDKIREDIEQNGPVASAAVPAKAAAPVAAAAGGSAQDVWLERQHPETGRVYYYNPARKETSWHRPENLISSGALQMGDGKGAWVSRLDPRTNRTFYYNPILGKTSWTNPDAEDEEPEALTKNQSSTALKRISMSVGAAAKAVSQRFSFSASASNLQAETFGNSDNVRNSARFVGNAPAVPVNKTNARVSMRLGGDIDSDRFAALRAMQAAKPVNEISAQVEAKADPLLLDLDRQLAEMPMNYPFSDFANFAQDNYNVKMKGFMNMSSRNVSLQSLLVHQKQFLKAPLLRISDKNLAADAMMGFKLILWYAGDKPAKPNTIPFAQEFVSLGMGTNELLKNELYCQLVKQTSGNGSLQSLELCWELFCIAAGGFAPMNDLKPYLFSHCKQAAEQPPTPRIGDLARYSLLRMQRFVTRLEPPSLQEVAAVRAVVPVQFRVTLISGTSVTVEVDAWSQMKDIQRAVEAKYQIQDGTPFAVFEVSSAEQERVLDGDDNVFDVVAYWERVGGDFQAQYKIRLYFDINEADTVAIELAYLQAVYEVLDQRYPCAEEDAMFLAALEAQEKFGDFKNEDVFGDQLEAYIPVKFFDYDSIDHLKAKIYRHYQSFGGYGKLQCMIAYLNFVKQWKYYGSQYYYAKPVQQKILGKTFPEQVIIGINSKGVLIIDPPSLELIAEYKYSQIMTWGWSPGNFVFVVGTLVRATKLFFKSADGQEMNSLIHAYVSKLMEAGAGQDGMTGLQDLDGNMEQAFDL